MADADIGLIGLAVMGQNLALNMNDRGFTVVVFNRTTSKVDDFLKGPASNTKIQGAHSLEEFFSKLKSPKKVMLMVKAGDPVDEFIELSLPFLKKGDIIIDGGNSLFTDSNRREAMLNKEGISFIGTGISGGEEGARFGPSIMPGGDAQAWEYIQPIFQAIAAKAEDGAPCCEWIGEAGSGHYVKMVHNGIEYGDIQLICEAYQIMSQGLGLNGEDLHDIFLKWNKTELKSYLIEIAAKIFTVKDTDGKLLLDKILDVAGQKGTGKWTAINALDLGEPLTLIAEAVFARFLSSQKEEREKASSILKGPKASFSGDHEAFLEDVRQALYASKIVSYAQGFMMLHQAKNDYHWSLNLGEIAMIWREGCIIRSVFLDKIKEAFQRGGPELSNLMLDPFFQQALERAQTGWRRVIGKAAELGIPIPCFSTALSFYDGIRCKRLPANLLQALRDFFGAHTYERVDSPRGKFFHTNWTGTGGDVSSSSYNA